MRFLFVDRIDEYVAGERLVGRVAFPRTLTYSPRRPDGDSPAPAILLESLAQSGGWLITGTCDFRVFAMMSLVRGFRVHLPAPSSELLRVTIKLGRLNQQSSTVEGAMATLGGDVIATVESIIYVHAKVDAEASGYWRTSFQTLRRERLSRRSQAGGIDVEKM